MIHQTMCSANICEHLSPQAPYIETLALPYWMMWRFACEVLESCSDSTNRSTIQNVLSREQPLFVNQQSVVAVSLLSMEGSVPQQCARTCTWHSNEAAAARVESIACLLWMLMLLAMATTEINACKPIIGNRHQTQGIKSNHRSVCLKSWLTLSMQQTQALTSRADQPHTYIQCHGICECKLCCAVNASASCACISCLRRHASADPMLHSAD